MLNTTQLKNTCITKIKLNQKYDTVMEINIILINNNTIKS